MGTHLYDRAAAQYQAKIDRYDELEEAEQRYADRWGAMPLDAVLKLCDGDLHDRIVEALDEQAARMVERDVARGKAVAGG